MRFSDSVDYWDIEEASGSLTALRLKNGEVIEAKDGFSRKFRIRAFHSGAWAYSETTEEGKKRELLKKTCESAEKLSRNLKAGEKYSLGEFSKGKTGYRTPAKKDPEAIEIGKKLSKAKEILRGAKGVNTDLGYSDSKSKIALETSEGLFLEQEITICGIFLSCIAREGTLIQRAFDSRRETAGFEAVESLGADFGKECAKRAQSLLLAKSPPSGKMQVIMDPKLVGTFVHEAVGHMAEADHIANKDSVLRGKLGRKIGSSLVTIVDDKTLPRGYGTRGFDRDGAKSELTTIIKEGALLKYMQSRNSAGRTKGKSTGNSWAEYNNVRMSNTYALPGKTKFSEILKETREGVYLIGSSGGTAQTSDGTFNFAATEGFLIRKGELAGKIRDVSLLGKTLETLKSIDYSSDGLEIESGHCGKNGEWVPVGSGGPHFRATAVVGGTG